MKKRKKAKTSRIDIPVDTYVSGVGPLPVVLMSGREGDFISVDTVGDYIDIDAKQLYAWLKEHYEPRNRL